jgi:catechol 2,3-dioxygenase-like lactoylglutathione lyase family enzyme
MDNPSIMSHVSIGVADVARSAAFYDAVLAVIDARRLVQHGDIIGYGRVFPEFWIGPPHDGGRPSAGNGTHFGFLARSREEVDAFWRAALDLGATPDGEPGPRPHYGPGYYGCFLRDPDGHKIEAQVTLEDPNGTGGEAEVEAHPT